MNSKEFKELYISVDIEATGPIPGPYSMSSLGAYAAGARRADGTFADFSELREKRTFYRELAPISDGFIPEAIKVGLLEGFDATQEDATGERRFQWMRDNGEDAAQAMGDFAKWVNALREEFGARPIFMAYPASFDWTFVYWYFCNFNIQSPFGFSGVLDLKSYYSARANTALGKSIKRNMPKSLFPDLPHTHHALDDATEQGIFGMRMLAWSGKGA